MPAGPNERVVNAETVATFNQGITGLALTNAATVNKDQCKAAIMARLTLGSLRARGFDAKYFTSKGFSQFFKEKHDYKKKWKHRSKFVVTEEAFVVTLCFLH